MAKCLCNHVYGRHNQYGCMDCGCMGFQTDDMFRREFQQSLQELRDKAAGINRVADQILQQAEEVIEEPTSSAGCTWVGGCAVIVIVGMLICLAVVVSRIYG